MIIVGPNIAPGQYITQVTGIVDLAPTILDLASSSGSPTMLPIDGRSLLPLLNTTDGKAGNAQGWRDTYLIEYSATTGVVDKPDTNHLVDNSNNTFIGLRILNETHDLAYFEFTDAVSDWNFKHTDFCEFYDLRSDPHQLKNLCTDSDSEVIQDLHQKLYSLWQCKGDACP